MNLEIGRALFLCGSIREVTNKLHHLSARLQGRGKVLFIDTLNSINPHHKAYSSSLQKSILKNIYCVRAEKPYDLLARLKTSDNFIGSKNIRSMLVNPLNMVFIDSNREEVAPLLNNIINAIEMLTEKHNLVTVIGNCPYQNENAMAAAGIILARENVVMVK